MAASQRNPVLFTRAADSQRNSVPLTSGCIPTEPGSVHPGQLHHNGTRFCSPGRPVLNGTRFCSPGRLVLNGTQFCSPRMAASQRNPVLFTPTAESQRNSVPFPGSYITTELGSVPGQLHPNGTQFCSRTAGSQRNPVLFTPDSCITTELGSVHPGG